LLRSVKHWSLITLREELIKIGAKVAWHSKYVTFQMAAVAVPQELFAAILKRIHRFVRPKVDAAQRPRTTVVAKTRADGSVSRACRNRCRGSIRGRIGHLDRAGYDALTATPTPQDRGVG